MDVLPSSSNVFLAQSSLSATSSCTSDARRFSNHSTDSNSRGDYEKSQKRYTEATFVRNAVALAVINRLHQWCCQLFWLTIVCVIGCCGDLKELQSAGKRQTLKQMRRNLVHSTQRSRSSMAVTELEMQLLRHLTCPQRATLRSTPMVIRAHNKRRHHLSRPPSPQLFDIREEELE